MKPIANLIADAAFFALVFVTVMMAMAHLAGMVIDEVSRWWRK